MPQIIVHDDGETWALAESVKLYDITDMQYHELSKGRSPKHMDLIGVSIHDPCETPGKEAEELRQGVEEVIALGLEDVGAFTQKLEEMLENVDARDSMRHCAVRLESIKEKQRVITEFLSQPNTEAKITEVLQRYISAAVVDMYKQYGTPAAPAPRKKSMVDAFALNYGNLLAELRRTPERACLALVTFKRVEEQTESLEFSNVGSDLAYLMAAILEDKHFEVSRTGHNDALVAVLHRCFDVKDPIWGFITNEE